MSVDAERSRPVLAPPARGGWVVRALASAAVLLVPAIAASQGCGPTRLKVAESVTLDMAPAKVWAIVGDFQDMSWDRETVATTGTGGNMPDKAVRTIRLKGGATFGESLYKYDAEAMSYSYHIDKIDVERLPVQNVSATIEVAPGADGGKSIVRWRGAFYRYLRPDEPAPDVADTNARNAVAEFLRARLAGLKAKAEART